MDVDIYRDEWRMLLGIPLLNEKYSFFYDETGNVRKFRLTENGVNADEGIANDFILGGVLYKGDTPPCDLDLLYEELKIKAPEIKFKTLAGRGSDFWTAIGKKPIHQFLIWLENSGLYVHYATLNNMYYSIVDMVDSLFVTQPQFNFGPEWVQILKASWHRFVTAHLDEILATFYRYDYPSIVKSDIKDFCYEISDLIQYYDVDDFYLENFRQLLKTNGRKGELFFVEDNTPGLLVEEYSSLRTGRCALYKDAMHNFDEEAEAESSLEDMPFTMNGKKLTNYKFIDSKAERLIQVSDVWVGLLGKLFFMLDESTPSMIKSKLESLNKEQKECIGIINSLIDRAEGLNRALIQNVNSIDMVQHRGSLLVLMGELV
ncbi:DUF3800 domain-containing protein [Clostridium algidicarnis]|uniref:DUF3800 domain-containing protein n=1 Tax=Clostridium algidicarnis TaxID=37659 RepID=UPI001C0D771B|nr:DUF3800 domain-containing protein [Clostridium algidicarnis]MBU3227800.1 DUF3800 domain-containing protein [Clostridium algidicarnis]MBU3251551.1 DUF3800 domain-containing protein [Clostridium algidicarnis]